ncbi:MAG: ATP-binding protein, partial [Candidatus Poribacteria bacterium]|nr:ATP-binding protein [Candidatus Poribacteria bacterium]
MTKEHTSFQAGIDFPSVLRIISKQVYETPLAFIRENVQNAVDAIRMQAHREHISLKDERYKIEITVQDKKIIVRDNGIGMSGNDLQNFFWTIGASGKRTQEALSAGCVGTFGIGGFANFGVCEELVVISQTKDCEHGTLTRLSEADIRAAGSSIPSVTKEPSEIASPRGTVVIGYLREPANVDDLRRYIIDFVRFVPMAVSFNGQKMSQKQFSYATERENYMEIGDGQQEWHEGDLVIIGYLFEDRGHTLVAMVESMSIGGEVVNIVGQLRFENGPIDIFKHGFKLCTTQIGSTIGV